MNRELIFELKKRIRKVRGEEPDFSDLGFIKYVGSKRNYHYINYERECYLKRSFIVNRKFPLITTYSIPTIILWENIKLIRGGSGYCWCLQPIACTDDESLELAVKFFMENKVIYRTISDFSRYNFGIFNNKPVVLDW